MIFKVIGPKKGQVQTYEGFRPYNNSKQKPKYLAIVW